MSVCVCVYMLYAADQVYGDQEMHSTVRNLCMDYMVSWVGKGSSVWYGSSQEYISNNINTLHMYIVCNNYVLLILVLVVIIG